jgi:TonB family protein
MKRVWAFLLFSFTLTHSLAMAQQPSHDASNTLAFENGTVTNDVYSNECLGFSLPTPAGWQIEGQVAGTAMRATHLSGKNLGLLFLFPHAEKLPIGRIALTAREADAQTETARDFVSNSVKTQLAAHEGRELIRDAFAVDYGSKEFFRSDYKLSSSEAGHSQYVAYVYTKFRGYLIGETIAASSQAALDEFANSLRQISFREDQANPNCIVAGDGASAAPTGSARPVRVRVSEGVAKAFLIKKVSPEYPADAREAHIQGQVVIQVEIDQQGNIQDVKLVSGHPLLAPPALEAVKQWKYQPYLLNGQPVNVESQVVVNFTLSP